MPHSYDVCICVANLVAIMLLRRFIADASNTKFGAYNTPALHTFPSHCSVSRVTATQSCTRASWSGWCFSKSSICATHARAAAVRFEEEIKGYGRHHSGWTFSGRHVLIHNNMHAQAALYASSAPSNKGTCTICQALQTCSNVMFKVKRREADTEIREKNGSLSCTHTLPAVKHSTSKLHVYCMSHSKCHIQKTSTTLLMETPQTNEQIACQQWLILIEERSYTGTRTYHK